LLVEKNRHFSRISETIRMAAPSNFSGSAIRKFDRFSYRKIVKEPHSMKKTRHKARSIWIDITFSIAIILLTSSAIFLVFMTEKGQSASQPDEKDIRGALASPVEIEQ